MNIGIETGEMCNRGGCNGIIEESEPHGCCSCHISPPCSHCVDDRHYCPICNWQGIDDQKNYPIQGAQGMYNRLMQRDDNYRDKIDKMRKGQMAIDKIMWYSESHTHFTMKKIGVYPINESRESVLKEIGEGTFGGRFEQFNNGKFTYIAYTD